jgi:hypothetical protein
VWTLALEVLPDCPEGRHEEMLLLATTDPLYPELRVPFTVVKKARQRVTAVPGSVLLRGSASGPLPARLVLLGSSDGEEVAVAKVEADNPAIHCCWAAGPGTQATLKVQVDRAQVRGDELEGNVRVQISRPAPQTLTIPLRCLLR